MHVALWEFQKPQEKRRESNIHKNNIFSEFLNAVCVKYVAVGEAYYMRINLPALSRENLRLK